MDELGIPWKFGLLGREIEGHDGRLAARDVLEDNRVIVQDQLRRAGIFADVAIPVLTWGTVLCHINGDLAVQTAYHGHYKLYIFTFKGERLKKKKRKFKKYPKVEVIGFPENYKGWVEL